jgi:hypothetical protein
MPEENSIIERIRPRRDVEINLDEEDTRCRIPYTRKQEVRTINHATRARKIVIAN